MPSDDVILNLKQIAGYPPAGIAATDMVVVQRGGLGGPYLSISASEFVSDALIGGGPLQVGFAAPAGTDPEQAFLAAVAMPLSGNQLWNAYVGNLGTFYLAGGPAGLFRFDASGFNFASAPAGGAGGAVSFGAAFNISPSGYVSGCEQVRLGRDPAAPMEAATAQWVSAQINNSIALLQSFYSTATVWSFNRRTGNIILNLCDVTGAGGAPIFSPAFQGVPTAPSPSPADNSGAVATTAWVWQSVNTAIAAGAVASFNGRTGAVVLTAADVQTAGASVFAPLASPAFSGVPTAPTAATATSTGQLATTAFVHAAVTAATAGVASFNTRTGAVVLTAADVTGAGGALLANPAFTGTPTAPTATAGTSTTQVASTAFVAAAVSAGVAGFAPLASPAFTGTPTAPTAATNTNSAQLATCAFVANQIAAVSAGVTTFNGRSGAVSLIANDISAAGGALLASPALTGVPTAPTAPTADSSTALATTAFVQAAITAAVSGVYLPLTGGTVSGGMTVTGQLNVNASLLDTSGNIISRASGAGNAAIVFQNNAGTNMADCFWEPTGGTVRLRQLASNGSIYVDGAGNFNSTGAVNAGLGYLVRQGTSGPFGSSRFNFGWSSPNVQVWIDTSNLGNMTISSDYRVKKDVRPLDSMWRRIKALRPVRYTHKDFAPIKADEVERWGLVAHELQETLIADAATGRKDAENVVQSPNPWTVIACLVKALQEAMTRIEALEAKA